MNQELELDPKIGMMVLYHRHGSPNGQHKAEPSPAIVTKVLEHKKCQLFVMNPNGVYFSPWPYRPTAVVKGDLQQWAKDLIRREGFILRQTPPFER